MTMPPSEAGPASSGRADDPPSQRRRDAWLMAWAVAKTLARLAAVWAAAHWSEVAEVIRRR